MNAPAAAPATRSARDGERGMFQNAANREKSLKLNEILKVLNNAVADYSSKNGFTIVLAKTQGIIYYTDPACDITKAITAELNRAWKSRKK